MAGDREAAPASRGTITEPAATPSSAEGSSPIAAVARAVSAGPAQVANMLRQFPAQRDAIIGWLHVTCGNAYVQAVLTHRAPEEGPAWDVVATPQIVQFPETEVGAVSPPRTVVLANRGHVAIDIESLELARHGGTGASAYPGEFELIQGQAGQLRPLETMAVQIVFRPTRVVTYIGARLRAKGHGAHDHVDVILKAVPAPARPDHADQRELSVAQHAARRFEITGTPSVQHYGDMLAAVLAARTLTDSAEANDTETHARVTKLLEPVARRLDQLNDHQGRLAQFGAGNIAGQAALDMSEAAVRSWLQRLALGARVRSEELVTKFRAGAESIRFLTGERADAPTLRAFDHASRMVGVGVGAVALVIAPPLIALAAEEAALLAFAGRLAAQRVAAWAVTNPAAALAASEALLGFGVQIGEAGREAFWDQLHDPQGRWFIIAQVLMDYMQVKSGMRHGGPSNGQRAAGIGGEPAPEPARAPELEAVRQRAAKVRAILQQVHDAAAATSDSGRSPYTAEVHTQSGRSQAAPAQDAPAHVSGNHNAVTGTLVPSAVIDVRTGKADAVGTLLEEIERNAGGLRRPALATIEPAEMARLQQEFADLGGDPAMLRFNKGSRTGFKDDVNTIQVRGDVNPVVDSLHPRSAMSSKAALGHELGHTAHRGTKLPIGAWNDEFRASYWAAKNLPNLSEQDRIYLILDAIERAKEAGVSIKLNVIMRKILYGY